MLSLRALAAATTLVGGFVLLVQTPALADHEVVCPPAGGDCTIVAHNPGSPGDPGTGGKPGGGSGGGITYCGQGDAGLTPGCFKEGLGWYNPEDECFYQLADPQPPAGDPIWAGRAPGDGKVYTAACGWPGLVGFIDRWRAAPPPGFGGLPSPAQLAAQAISQLPIRGPIINTAPKAEGSGLVGLPIWIWTPVTEATWGPASRTASVPGLSVTATARAEKIAYRMGDGTSVTCASPGTPYQPSYGNRPSPDCGYEGYSRPSSTVSGGRYTVTGITTWAISWAGGGQSDTLTVTRTSTASIDIDELQVVTS
ncbi:hypothetical protein OHQ88_33930 (plasmid) [Micromonospora zamorensis]|uniref:hypothetical protein n=1 Tax=Micromonospora zamorensis TaxID=709883 RepID=UPI002E1AB9C4